MVAGTARGGSGRFTRRRLLGAGALAFPLALVGCLFRRTPATPALIATPTPRPTPTATPAPERVPLPTPVPATPPPRAPTAAVAPTPAPFPELRDAGDLIYSGNHDGRTGIFAVRADGGDRRLLVPNFYEGLCWAPDGRRFAAIGLAQGNAAEHLAIFAADGRPLARIPFAGQLGRDLQWSPDSRRLLCRTLPSAAEVTGGESTIATWVVDDDGAREVGLGGDTRAFPIGWSPSGRLAFVVPSRGTSPAYPSEEASIALVTLDASGNVFKWVEGAFYPLGWSPDEGTVYALGDLRPIAAPGTPGEGTRPTSLIVIDTRNGAWRTIATAADLAAAVRGGDPGAGSAWFDNVFPAPGGRGFALWLGARPDPTAPTRGPARDQAIVLVDGAGRPLAHDRPGRSAIPSGATWAPDGERAAYFFFAPTGNELHILAREAGTPLIYPLGSAFTGSVVSAPAWSPDGHWVAYAGGGGVAVVAATGEPRTFILAAGAAWPAWRPRGA